MISLPARLGSTFLILQWKYLGKRQMSDKKTRERTRQIATDIPNSIFLIGITTKYCKNHMQRCYTIDTAKQNTPQEESNPIGYFDGIRRVQQLQIRMSNILLQASRKSMSSESAASAHINKLVEKLEKISSSIHIDVNLKNLKLFQADKASSHFREDPITLLRNLENRSQMNRAEVQLMNQRRPKHYSVKSQRYQQEDTNRQTYINIYKRLQNQKAIKRKQDTELTSQDQQMDLIDQAPSGVKHYNQLRQHPRLLQYTLQRMRDKSGEQRNQLRKIQSKMEIKSARKEELENSDFKQIIEGQLNRRSNPLDIPTAIVDNQMTKFFSKSSKGKLDFKIKENPRCVKMLQRQQRIVNQLQDRAISKQNMKKLKERLNIIVNDISKSDRNQKIEKLPKLAASRPEDQ